MPIVYNLVNPKEIGAPAVKAIVRWTTIRDDGSFDAMVIWYDAADTAVGNWQNTAQLTPEQLDTIMRIIVPIAVGEPGTVE